MRRYVWIPLVVVSSSGCYSWQLQSVSAREVIEQQEPELVRVTGPDGRVTMHEPRVSGDSISGRLRRQGSETSVPLDEVRRIEVRALDEASTVGAVIAVPFLIYAVPAILYISCCLDGAP